MTCDQEVDAKIQPRRTISCPENGAKECRTSGPQDPSHIQGRSHCCEPRGGDCCEEGSPVHGALQICELPGCCRHGDRADLVAHQRCGLSSVRHPLRESIECFARCARALRTGLLSIAQVAFPSPQAPILSRKSTNMHSIFSSSRSAAASRLCWRRCSLSSSLLARCQRSGQSVSSRDALDLFRARVQTLFGLGPTPSLLSNLRCLP